jgi:spore coat polysaccharide biosynthesis protein SpsF (cytidylyltransferase family)
MRLPGKVLSIINDKPIIEWQILRVMQTKGIDEIVLATSDHESDSELMEIAKRCGIHVTRGSLNNVFSRFIHASNKFSPRTVVRITGDCPLYMPNLCGLMLTAYQEDEVEYLSNTIQPTYPDGCDIEIFSVEALKRLAGANLSASELEHVTLGFHNRSGYFKLRNFSKSIDDSSHRWTLDTQDDLQFIKRIYTSFSGQEVNFDYEDVMTLLRQNPSWAHYDDGTMRNRGAQSVN